MGGRREGTKGTKGTEAIKLSARETKRPTDPSPGREKIRAVLRKRTGSVTLPQIFVGGGYVGGCTDVFDRIRSGDLQALLARHGVDHDSRVSTDPYAKLPLWLHPR